MGFADMAREAIREIRREDKTCLRPVEQNPLPSYEELKVLYLDAFNRVGWTQGLMARPEVTQAEDRLNQVWLDCMGGRASLEDFKRTITEWEGIISRVTRQIRG